MTLMVTMLWSQPDIIYYGDNPRNHIWTFVAALDEAGGRSVCPCSSSESSVETSPPSFVGDDYFCDAGAVTFAFDTFYGDNPLWDGSGCGSTSTCCSFNTPPRSCLPPSVMT